MQTLKARKLLRYGGRRLQPGDLFTANASHARLLVAVGSASTVSLPLAPQPPRRAALLAPRTDHTEDPPPVIDQAAGASLFAQAGGAAAPAPAEPPAADEPSADADKPRRTYRRRDMAAGD